RERYADGHLSTQAFGQQMDERRADRAFARPEYHGDHHVRPCRDAAVLGTAFVAPARLTASVRRHHRMRSTAVRAYGSADVPAWAGAQGSDVSRGGADAWRGATRLAPADHQYPGVVG